MANNAEINMKIVGNEKNLKKFMEYVDLNYSDTLKTGQLLLFDACKTPFEKNDTIILNGWCKWSIHPMINRDVSEPSEHPILKELAEILKLKITVHCEEPLGCFQEYYFTDGRVEKYKYSDYDVEYDEEDEDLIINVKSLLFPMLTEDFTQSENKYIINSKEWV